LSGLTLTGTTHTNAQTYSVDGWSSVGGTTYHDASGTVDDKIDKAAAAISITPYHVTYDGAAHTATGTATGVSGANLSSGLTLTRSEDRRVGKDGGDGWCLAGCTNNEHSSRAVD